MRITYKPIRNSLKSVGVGSFFCSGCSILTHLPIALIYLSLLLLSCHKSYAENPIHVKSISPTDNKKIITLDSISSCIKLSVKYLIDEQFTETVYGTMYKGEWPTYMVMQMPFPLLGSRKKIMDSNCFSVASTHNLLARIYFSDTTFANLPFVMQEARVAILKYKNGKRFNFWNLLPPQRDLYNGDSLFTAQLVRRPTQFKLRSRYIHKAANIAEDADDTALSYTAFGYAKRVNQEDTLLQAIKLSDLYDLFAAYRDKNRKNRHWYNYFYDHSLGANTGVFLTWHSHEYRFKKWSLAKVFRHNATFYLPSSACYPKPYIPYLPYGSNDFDAVVNANVLGTLSLYGMQHSEGYDETVRYLIRKCCKLKFDRVATYYPNRFQFAFSIAMAISNGVTALDTCSRLLTPYLLKSQKKDGSWKSAWYINRGDRVQSTAYAINYLLMMDNEKNIEMSKAIEKGILYLITQMKRKDHTVYWEGGVMFSGGTVVRTSLFWKSNAYTTALVAHAFSLYQKKS